MNSRHKHSQLNPTIGSVQLTFYGVGVIVGAGVYSVIGAASAIAHDALWFSFVIGGFVAFLTGLSYAEMATAFPAAGAEYSYVRRAFPKAEWISVLVALTILIGASATASTVAVAFGGYLREFVDLPQPVSALLLLIGCSVLNVIGLRESSWANILFTFVEVGGLLAVGGIHLPTLEAGSQGAQRLTRVGDEHARAVLRGVEAQDVDVDEAHVLVGEDRVTGRGEVGVAGADADDDVGLAGQRVGR